MAMSDFFPTSTGTRPLTVMTPTISTRPQTLKDLVDSGWRSRSVKQELRENFLQALAAGGTLYPGIVGYDDTVIPELNIAILSGHDMLFMGEKGQAKSRLMRSLVRFLDAEIPYLDVPESPFHEDPLNPLSRRAIDLVHERRDSEIPIRWWRAEDRYAERLAPGTKFADIIGEIDPAKLAGGCSMSTEDALHFGLIPRMHRGIFAVNELPELDELVQVGLFNILEERDVQIRGFPIRFDIDVMILFSANPSTYNRSGKVIPQLKDRIGSLIRTHYPRQRDMEVQIVDQEAGIDLGGEYPVVVPYFMKEICQQVTIEARRSKYVDHQSGVSARLSIANYRTMVSSARHRGVILNEKPAVPRISDLAHLCTSSLGKLELDLMGSHQMSEQQVLDGIIAQAISSVFDEYVTAHGLEEIAEVFSKGIRIEVGDMVPSADYAKILKRVPQVWEKAFEVNASESDAVRAACVEFVLAGLYARNRISRAQRHGVTTYEV
jgi:magnesium chelatase subunit I